MILIDASGADGNAFAIMGATKSVLRQLGQPYDWKAIQERMMESDYAHLCAVANEVTGGLIEVVNLDEEEDEDDD